MIRPFEEVNKDWTFFDWDEWDSVRSKLGEDKFEEVKGNLYDILEHVYGVGFNEGYIDTRHCFYKYKDKIRKCAMNFYRKVIRFNGKTTVSELFDFVTDLLFIDENDILDKNEA